MSDVTSPIITDATGQAILSKLNEIKQVLSTPSDAEDINYDNTTSGMTADNVQSAVDELKSNLTDLQVYSTTEKVVGIWTDGRPIYRKSYSGNAVKSGTVTLDTINTLDLIVGSSGSAVSDYNWIWTIPNGDTSGYANRLRFSTSTKALQIYFDVNYNTSCTYNITVDYVKTV